MDYDYPQFDAKARLSALVRQVREGATVVITVHGERVAELRPYVAAEPDHSLTARIAELTARGELVPPRMAPGESGSLRVGRPNPGVVQRFLADRD
jgi:prevent-host-death family protein